MQPYDYYPKLDGLNIVLGFVGDDPVGYLEGPNCPYDEVTKAALRGLVTNVNHHPIGVTDAEVEKLDIESEAIALYQETKEFRARAQSSGEVGDQAAALRVANSLLEKLLNIRERAHNLKENVAWKKKILQFIEDVLDDEQRIEFDNRLAAEIEVAR
ncbi:hypothetical protein [Inquilinus limosus]|uniref:Uncharacterized protein n=1 Tax=Inquilinus limosus MP06 TaxID=1398085 RepID=A0A0A0DBP8_9PROT|nr:hypothetical protein [Inquilinus limosus]KGM36141.1 hypothetical protein P409_00400 [Inquilinus limosus MP06]